MTDNILLTQAAYDRLRDELEQLILVERGEIAKKIQEAREEGDLKENGGYHAAKEEQGKLEARINRLEEMLSNAEIGSACPSYRLCLLVPSAAVLLWALLGLR